MIRRCAAAVVAVLLLSGCSGSGAGVAAFVGDHRIMTATLREYVERGLSDKRFAQSAPQRDYQREVLFRFVREELVEIAARRLHVSITDAEVDRREASLVAEAGSRDALVQQAAAGGIAAADIRAAVRNATLRDAVADKLVADVKVTEEQLRAEYRRSLVKYDVARIAHILLADKGTADRVAAQARAGGDFAALAKQFSKDIETKEAGGLLGRVGNGEGRFAPAFEEAVFGGRTGSILGPLATAGGYEVIKVIERRTQAFADVRDELRRAVIGQARDQRIATYIIDLAKQLGVRVNPRFGQWDPQSSTIVGATNDLLSRPESPAPAQPVAPQPTAPQPSPS